MQAISIHALREEGDVYDPELKTTQNGTNFYPRPPRGGRQARDEAESNDSWISIHALREEGDLLCGSCWGVLSISIHALREEGDLISPLSRSFSYRFLSTPSARRATAATACERVSLVISIHALREEGDDLLLPLAEGFPAFLSTPSARRATFTNLYVRQDDGISIHALREEGDMG